MASTYGRSQRDCRQRRKSKGYYQKLIIQKLMGACSVGDLRSGSSHGLSRPDCGR